MDGGCGVTLWGERVSLPGTSEGSHQFPIVGDASRVDAHIRRPGRTHLKRVAVILLTTLIVFGTLVAGQAALASPVSGAGNSARDIKAAAAPAVGSGAPRTMGFVRTTSGNYPKASRMMAERSAASLPSKVDLSRGDLPIGNQGKQSSCVAWASSYYYKTLQEAKDHGWSLSTASHQFSPSFIYNQINAGKDKGSSFPSAFQVMQDTGDVDLNTMAYNQNDYLTQPNAQQKEAAKPFQAKDYSYIWRGAGNNDVNEIKAHLAAGDPVALGIPVYQAFYFCQGNWVGVPASSEQFYGNHGICAVGYDDSAGGGQGGIKVVNSWGSEWGAGGYTYLSYQFVANYVWEAWTMTDRTGDRPAISSLSPNHGTAAATVAIKGNNFGTCRGVASIKFGGTAAQISGWVNDTIYAKVPAGVIDCKVTVTNYLGETSNGMQFSADLGLTGVAPGAAKPGQRVTLRGVKLGSGGTLKWGSATIPVVSWSDNKIVFDAPKWQASGPLKVYQGSMASNEVEFSVYNSIWYLAEGCTNGGFETWVLVQNPNATPADINITYMTPQGTVQGPRTKLAANSRQTFNVADVLPGQWQVSTRVTSDKNIIAERSMYGHNRKWGSDSVGVEAPSSVWYLAEGSTTGGFESWILVQNPNSSPTHVMLTYMTPTGKVNGPYVTLAGNSRQSFNIADTLSNAGEVATQVTSDDPVIAERSVYWNGRTGAHDSVGVTGGAKTWYLAEGCTSGGFETWIPVMNPGSKDARVTLTYMTDRGEVKGPTVVVKAGTRHSFFAADTVPNTWSVSTKVTSDQPIVAERSCYWNNRIEGTNSMGVTSPADSWDLAEGCTGAGFETWVLVQNPNSTPTKITLTYMTPGGSIAGPKVTLPANSRKTFFVADTVPNQWQVSTRVTADKPVIAERSMYGSNRTWGHDSVGISK